TMVSGASATTVTNLESAPLTVKIQSAGTEGSVTVLPSEKKDIDHLCTIECSITLHSGDEYEFAKDDNIILEDGGVFFEPVAQGSGQSGLPRPQ
ncbi:MAG: hypothetical protein OEM91_09515, partial [Hyphomicrobiales bacterium]|nr:hypothetical protein [Hyphomicrobiales bacterium]